MVTKTQILIEGLIKDNPIGIGKEYTGTRWGMTRINKNEYFIEDVKTGKHYEVVRSSVGKIFTREISIRDALKQGYL